MYDTNNIFYKILKKEIDANIVKETEYSLAFYDKFPKADIHILVIPKGQYIDFSDFQKNASREEKDDFWQLCYDIGNKNGNFQLLTNNGAEQFVFHFHMHILHNYKW